MAGLVILVKTKEEQKSKAKELAGRFWLASVKGRTVCGEDYRELTFYENTLKKPIIPQKEESK